MKNIKPSLQRILRIVLSSFLIPLASISLAAEKPVTDNTKNASRDVVIINYGIYAHTPDNGKSWINPISDKKVKGKSTAPVHVKTTRDIPAQYPLFFGFEYQLNNLEGRTLKIDTVVTHPEITHPDGSTSKSYKQSNQFLILDGQVTATNGYLLEHKKEATPGKWTFKIKHDGETIIEQHFMVRESL